MPSFDEMLRAVTVVLSVLKSDSAIFSNIPSSSMPLMEMVVSNKCKFSLATQDEAPTFIRQVIPDDGRSCENLIYLPT